MPIFGAHESIAGGFDKAIERLVAVGGPGRSLQLFVQSPQQRRATPITSEQVLAFVKARERYHVEHIVAHASYLINPAASDEAIRERSIAGFAEELRRCAILGIREIVVHPGSGGLKQLGVRSGSGSQTLDPLLVASGCDRVADSLYQVFRILDAESPDAESPDVKTLDVKTLDVETTKDSRPERPPYLIAPQKVRILLETTAGQGASLGRSFHELARMIQTLKSISETSATPIMNLEQRIGVCVDTIHLYAAGYVYDTSREYDSLIQELDSTVGCDTVRAFHISGSQKDCGSHVDRHAHLDEGKLEMAAIARFVRDPRWADRPMILETPKGTTDDGEDRDTANLRILDTLWTTTESPKSRRPPRLFPDGT